MNLIIFSLLVILIGGSIIPADAQITINKNAIQKSIEVNIDSIGNVHVKHVIKSANSPKQVELIYGTVSNLSVVNELGEENQFSVIGDNVGVLIFPSSSDSIVEYDLEHVLVQKIMYGHGVLDILNQHLLFFLKKLNLFMQMIDQSF